MQVPMGVQDFKEIRDLGGYFIDKSALIDYVLSNRMVKAFLFTRPRRFGKSTNLSMLDAYLNMNYEGNTWFDGLKISEMRPNDPDKNSVPVISIDLKGMGNGSYDVFVQRFRKRAYEICRDHLYLMESERLDPVTKELFASYYEMKSDEVALPDFLRDMCVMLHRHHGQRPVVLIDEYDDILNRSYGLPDQRSILDFMRDLLSSALKGNDSLRFGVITGIMQIAKESIFSGLNNLYVDNILSTNADEMFGFTACEVERLCADFDHPEKFDEVREWYDGYRFGNAEIYNPWSVLSYVKAGFRPAEYWAGTSGNSIIDDLISNPDEETIENLMALGSGGTISANLRPGVTFADISDRGSGIYSVMAFSGYLNATASGNGCLLSIPNREMYEVFTDMVLERLGASVLDSGIRDFRDALLGNDPDSMSSALRKMLQDSVSFRVLGHETSYQLFIVGLLMSLHGNYRITADFESGDGRHDIRMERLHGDGPNVLMEIKRASDRSGQKSLEDLAEMALRQIHEKDYCHGLNGKTILYGIAFDGKHPSILSETLRS